MKIWKKCRRGYGDLSSYVILLLAGCVSSAAEEVRVVPDRLPNGVIPGDMVQVWMKGKLMSEYEDWQENFLRLQEEGGWEEHHRTLRRKMIELMGGFPERTPLKPQVTGVLRRPGFRVEKVLIESRPDFLVSANLYVPESGRFDAPYPGVLVPCGHAHVAKAHDEYQSMGALLALNGMVGLVFDPLDQGERQQYQRDDGSRPYYGTHMHMQEGVIATLLGDGLIQYFAWDGIRALDYLVSRPEVDPDLLGITGNSGGGTQTSFIFALDDRLKVAAPSCWLHLLRRQIHDSMGDWEQMHYGQMSSGIEQPSLYMMRAPAPVKVLASTHDFFQIDAVWESFRWIKRHYTDLGFSERADILENNEGHNYNRTQREAAMRWFNQWLKGRVETIWEPRLDLFTSDELWATPEGQVMEVEGARSIFDLFREKLEAVRSERDSVWDGLEEEGKRRLVRSALQVRPLVDIPRPVYHDMGRIERDGYTILKGLLETEEGLFLPLLDLRPVQANGETPLLYVSTEGAGASAYEGGWLDEVAKSGRPVVAVDPRGVGETAQKFQVTQGGFFGTDQEDVQSAYVLGESYLGMRVEDILRAVRYARGGDRRGVDLYGEGQIAVAALHAAFLEPGLIGRTRLVNCLGSWESILKRERSFHQLANAVHGVLLRYDLPHLKKALGGKLTEELPVDSLGFEIAIPGTVLPADYHDPKMPGLVGTFFGSSSFFNPQGEYPLDALSIDYDNAVEKRGNDWGGIWSGFLVGPHSGEITFTGITGQALALSIDGRSLMELEDFPGSHTAVLVMEEGKTYPLEVRYQLSSGGVGSFNIRWNWEGRQEEIISGKFLRHSRAQVSELRKTWR